MDACTPIQTKILSLLEDLEKEESLQSVEGFAAELELLKERMQDDVFRIAVVGEFSSGKSTFINALLGRDVLSHASKETTAVLTQVVNVASDDPRVGTGLVRHKDGTEQEIRTDELREYTTTVSERHAVAQEIASVDIYTPLLHAERPLMLIDTPGLNGVASGHLDQTIRVVQEAHACIYLLQHRGLTKEDLAFLRGYLVPCQQNFIFVQNFIDAFRPHEGESVEQRLPMLERTLREEVFAGSESHTFCVCGVSALKELAGQDRSITYLYEDSTDELDDGARAQLREESNFASFRALMEENFNERRLAEIQYRGTANAILGWARSLLERIARRAEEARSVFELSREHRAIERLTQLQEKLKEMRAKNCETIDGLIARKVNESVKELGTLLEQCGQRAEQEVRACVDACHTPDEIQRRKEEVPVSVARILNAAQQEIRGTLQDSMQLLHEMIVERIEEYSGIGRLAGEVRTVAAGDLPALAQMRADHGTDVEARTARIAEKRAQEEQVARQLAQTNRAASEAERDVRHWADAASEAYRTQRSIQDEMRRMGSRPAVRVWQEEHVVKRTSLLGRFLDFFSTKTEVRTMRDDSAQQDWDARYKALQAKQNTYAARRDDLLARKAKSERKLRSYQGDAEADAARIRRLEQSIREDEALLEAERRKRETQQKHAMQAYLAECRRDICNWVHTHLYGADGTDGAEGELGRLEEAWRKQLRAVQEEMQDRAHRLYDEAEAQKLAQLEQAKQDKAPALQRELEALTRADALLQQGIRKMEGDLT